MRPNSRSISHTASAQVETSLMCFVSIYFYLCRCLQKFSCFVSALCQAMTSECQSVSEANLDTSSVGKVPGYSAKEHGSRSDGHKAATLHPVPYTWLAKYPNFRQGTRLESID